MQKRNSNQWQPGMILALPVENNIGVPLAPAGAKLTANLILQFQRFGVDSIAVEGEAVLSDAHNCELEAALEELKDRFCHVQDQPLMQRIQDLFIQSLRKRYGNY